MSQLLITQSDLGPLVLTLSLLLLAWIAVAVIGRGVTKAWILRRLAVDDVLMITCLILSIAQTVTVAVAAANGLGKHQSTLSPRQLAVVQKTLYASDMLLVLSLLCAKLATLSGLYALSPVTLHKNLVFTSVILSLIWAITAEFVFAFRCPVPHTWDWTNTNCHDQITIGSYIAVMNLLTELTLIVTPVVIIKGLQLAQRRKIVILLLFSFRLSVIAAIICQLIYLRLIGSSNDFSFNLWRAVVCTQFVQFTCIAATCIVYLKPYLECLESGFIRVDDTRRKEGGTYPRNNLYPKSSNGRAQSSLATPKNIHSNSTSGNEDMHDAIELLQIGSSALN